MLRGGKDAPWLEQDENLRKSGQISFSYLPIAQVAELHDGSISTRHVVVIEQRTWRALHGVFQWTTMPAGRSTGLRTHTPAGKHRTPRRNPKTGKF